MTFMTLNDRRHRFGKRFLRNHNAMIGLIIIVFVLGVAIFAGELYPKGPFMMVGRPFLPPNIQFLFGTDLLGRDVAAGIAFGARTSLFIGFFSTCLAVCLGVIVGGVAGFYGGWVDAILMRLTEFFQTIPFFIFAILIVVILRPSSFNTTVAIAVVLWPPMARLVRAEFMSLRHREFVEACAGLGMHDFRLICVHMLPNCAVPIVVMASLMIATAILIESSLSFLGLSDPNAISWGSMIGTGREYLSRAPWLCVIPGAAIMLTVIGINLLGEGLNATLSPRRS